MSSFVYLPFNIPPMLSTNYIAKLLFCFLSLIASSQNFDFLFVQGRVVGGNSQKDGPSSVITPLHPSESDEYNRLYRNRELWYSYAGSEENNYDMEFERRCYCPWDYLGPFLMKVREGEVSGGSYKDDGEVITDAYFLEAFLNVEKAFELIETTLDNGYHRFEVEYNETAGYPSYIYIDYHHMIADDEIEYNIRNVMLKDDPTSDRSFNQNEDEEGGDAAFASNDYDYRLSFVDDIW